MIRPYFRNAIMYFFYFLILMLNPMTQPECYWVDDKKAQTQPNQI